MSQHESFLFEDRVARIRLRDVRMGAYWIKPSDVGLGIIRYGIDGI